VNARPLPAFALAALALAASPASPRAAPAESRPKVAVLDLQANGAAPALAAAATSMVATEVSRLGVFQVITAEAIRAMLALELQRKVLGACAGGGCAGELGSALGADLLVSGKVSLIGGGAAPATFALDLVLSSTASGKQEGTASEAARSEAELVALVPRAVGKLTARLLAARSGRLVVSVSEAGALVKVDDQARGTTPLPGPLVLPSGPRALAVEKEGFVAWQSDVTVHHGRLVEERVTLVPSPDFIRRYESRAKVMRWGAWAGTGLAVLGAGAFAAFQLRANSLYGNATTDGTFLYYKQKLVDGAAAPSGVDWRQRAEGLKNRVNTAQNLSYAGAGAALLGGGVAVWLWAAGDDPGRYARYRGAVAAAPTPGGLQATLALAF